MVTRIFTSLPSHKLGENIRVVEDFREEMLNENIPWSFSISTQHYECHSKQILINILNNAIKFTKEGYVRVYVTGEPGASSNVESVYGEGTTFTITIPQKIVDRRSITEMPKSFETGLDQTEQFTAPGLKALVVDDNVINRKVARGFVDKPFHQEQLLKVFEEALL